MLIKNDEFTVKVAETLEKVCRLLEAGFEYVKDIEAKKLLHERKKYYSSARNT